MEAADSESCDAEQAELVHFDDGDEYIARLQREGAWDEDIDAELSKLVSMQEIREGVTTGEQTSDVSNLVSSAEPTCVADAVRRANESLSPRPLSNVWEEGVYDAIFTGDMTKWLDVFDSSLHRLVEPPDFLADEVPELQQSSKRQRVMNRTFSKVTAADHDETWQQSRQEQLEAGLHKMVELMGCWTQCETDFEQLIIARG